MSNSPRPQCTAASCTHVNLVVRGHIEERVPYTKGCHAYDILLFGSLTIEWDADSGEGDQQGEELGEGPEGSKDQSQA